MRTSANAMPTSDNQVSQLLLGYTPVTREMVEGILNQHDLRDIKEGELIAEGKDGEEYVKYIWKQIKRSPGKHQAVGLIGIGTPEDTQYKIAVRAGRKEYGEIYHKYAFVRKHFPKLYTSFQGYLDGEMNYVYASERVVGYEEKHDHTEFREFITKPESKAQLYAWVQELMQAIVTLPIMITDFSPTDGHNAIYNSKEKRFQLFDIDTVWLSNESNILGKLLNFINGLIRQNQEAKELIFMLLKDLYGKYGDTLWETHISTKKFQHLSFKFTRGNISDDMWLTEERYRYKQVLPTDPDYNALYQAVTRGGVYRSGNNWERKPIHIDVSSYNATISVQKGFLDYIKNDDFEGFCRAYTEINGSGIMKKGYHVSVIPNAEVEKMIQEYIVSKPPILQKQEETPWTTVIA